MTISIKNNLYNDAISHAMSIIQYFTPNYFPNKLVQSEKIHNFAVRKRFPIQKTFRSKVNFIVLKAIFIIKQDFNHG
jgi:hypothetical protein